MTACPRCFHQNVPEARECELCGTRLGDGDTGSVDAVRKTKPSVATILAALERPPTEEIVPVRPTDSGSFGLTDPGYPDPRMDGLNAAVSADPGRRAGVDHSGSAADDHKVCLRCGAFNTQDAIQCAQCGTTLSARHIESSTVEVDTGVLLVAINEDGTDGARIPLNREVCVVGRVGDVAYPSDVFLSPRHAAITVRDGRVWVEDLYSLNGTYLKLRGDQPLTPGDTFLMGRQVLRLQRFDAQQNVRSRAADGTRYMGSPPAGGRFKLEQIGVGGIVQDVYCLPAEGALIGREKGDVTFPKDKFMSSRHAQISPREDGSFTLADLNSSNGTWIKIWERQEIARGDFLFLGQQLFRLELEG